VLSAARYQHPQAAALPQPSAAVARRCDVRVLLVVRPDDDTHLRRPGLAGHPASLDALRAAGASVQMIRASCLCQGERLVRDGRTIELFGETSRQLTANSSSSSSSSASFSDSPAAPSPLAASLARGLTHLRCWAEACRLDSKTEGDGADAEVRGPAVGVRGPVIILEAGCRLQALASGGSAEAGACAGAEVWSRLLWEAEAAARRGEDLLALCGGGSSLGQGASASAYVLAPRLCSLLAECWEALARDGVEGAEALVQRLVQSLGLRAGCLPLLLPPLEPCAAGLEALLPPPPPLRPSASREGEVKIYIITLPHREDRRRSPLVCGPEAIEAMRAAGFDVEILRASCYCERDALQARGGLGCYLEDSAGVAGSPHWVRMKRYEGAEVPVGKEEAERLRKAIDENYEEGSDRLVDSMGGDGGIEGYVVDSNWPGATSCAMSHTRALMTAALDGYSFALVFEDDAVIPTSVAWKRGWCEGRCTGKLCFCPGAWGACIEDAVELARRGTSGASTGDLDVLYLGMGEAFERPGPSEGVLAGEGGALGAARRWLGRSLGPLHCGWPGSVPPRAELGGLTQLGYTWQAQAMLYTRRALEDLLAFPLSEVLWAQDETIPHLYGRRPWNHRYLEALRAAGWARPWVAAGPADAMGMGWVYQLETLTSDAESDLGLGTAWHSSNAEEF